MGLGLGWHSFIWRDLLLISPPFDIPGSAPDRIDTGFRIIKKFRIRITPFKNKNLYSAGAYGCLKTDKCESSTLYTLRFADCIWACP